MTGPGEDTHDGRRARVLRFFRMKQGCRKCMRWWARIELVALAVAVLADAALSWHERRDA